MTYAQAVRIGGLLVSGIPLPAEAEAGLKNELANDCPACPNADACPILAGMKVRWPAEYAAAFNKQPVAVTA